MAAKANLTAGQEREIYERATRGEKYESIGAAYGLHKSSVARVVQRAQQRALTMPPIETAADPKTGIAVEVTDDMVMGQVVRDLMTEYHNAGSLEDKISIAHVLPKLAVARQRVRVPAPGPKPPEPGQPPQPEQPGKPDEEELVRFN